MGSSLIHELIGPSFPGNRLESGLGILRTAAVLLMTAAFSLAAVMAGLLTRSDRVPARIIARWGKTLLLLSGCDVLVQCPSGLPDGGGVMVANHHSYLDPPLLLAVFGAKIRIVAKRELGNIPLFGKGIVSAGTLLVDRKDAKETVRWVSESVRLIRRGNWLVVFPEGTRSDDGLIRNFQMGAFFVAKKCGLPVYPVLVDGGQRALPRGQWFIRPSRMTVNVLNPVQANGLSTEDMARIARERILSAQNDLCRATGKAGSMAKIHVLNISSESTVIPSAR